MEGLPRARRGERDYLNALTYSVQSPPIVVGDLVITPASISSLVNRKEQIPGWIRAFDARTGRVRWTFHTIPRRGEPGYDTWTDGSAEEAGKVTVWTLMSADETLGHVYLPTNTVAPDFYGGHRPGDNLFAESLIAVDLASGRRVWHFQTVHHGLWDYDNPAAPNLIDLTIDGRQIKAVAQISKQGFVYTFDRTSGHPIWPIVERPVPASDVPGERASPTQPIPTRPPPFEQQGVTVDDLADFTPEIKEMALAAVKPFRLGPLYTPPSLEGTLVRPSTVGGGNWSGAAVDPETGLMYVPSRNGFGVSRLARPEPAVNSNLLYMQAPARSPQMPQGLPLLKPPYSRLTAIDMNRGEHVWMTPAGRGDRIRLHPLLKDSEPAAARRRQHVQRPAADEDAADLRAHRRRDQRWSAAGGLRQGVGQGTGVGRSSRARDRDADDVCCRRSAVHRADRAGPHPARHPRARRADAAVKKGSGRISYFCHPAGPRWQILPAGRSETAALQPAAGLPGEGQHPIAERAKRGSSV